MVDVGRKPVTRREAVARGTITIAPEALQLIRTGSIAKGDPLQTARLAGIMAVKRTGRSDPAVSLVAALARRGRSACPTRGV